MHVIYNVATDTLTVFHEGIVFTTPRAGERGAFSLEGLDGERLLLVSAGPEEPAHQPPKTHNGDPLH